MKKRPNILFILSDDQGAWAMHCSGTPELYTPNLDRIAASGMRFDNFYCASPVCSPARASLLTGTIPSAHGVLDWLRGGNLDGEKFAEQGQENPYADKYTNERKPIGYLDGQTAYTDILAENGYTCALSGKWHMGDSVRPQHGFSKWYTIGLGGCCYYHPDIVEDGNITVEHGKYVTELFTNRALEYLDTLDKEEEPFYLAVHYTAPHSPWGREHHPEKWIQYYEDCDVASIPDIPDHPDLITGPVYGTERRKENLRGYFAAVSAMDEQIGRILDALEEKQLAEDTIVIFTADNGMSMGQHGVWGKGNATFPMNMYDSAVKVPFLISYPGVVPAGTVCHGMVSACDLFPTLLELTGMGEQMPEGLPGRSFATLLHGTAEEHEGEIVVFDEYGPVRMIRDREWKYVHRYPYGRQELYHLTEDPGEEKNLYGQPGYEKKALEMKIQMEKWFLKYVNPELDGTKEGVTGSGQLCRPGIHADRPLVYPPVGT
ncbi:MAG: sulfatase-like hydrolase/transferase [Lachnospiraceae bacterium]|nr:sulfatase-like hydrolase/transferase [Lachnospiraceae bacterium]